MHIRNFSLCCLFAIAVLSNHITFAQNYDAIITTKPITFENELFDIFFTKVDNYEISGSDTIFNFQHKIDTTVVLTPECLFGTNDTIPLGMKVIKQGDSSYVFFNKYGDSIFIEPYHQLGESWRFYTYENGDFIKATYSEKLYGTIFDTIVDSLKRISLAEFTADVVFKPLAPWTNEKFDVTQHYGLSRFFNLNDFPEPNDTIAYRLAGSASPRRGITDINAHHAFDFQPGYEFHIKELTKPDVASDSDIKISSFKYFILSKNEEIDKVTYAVERIQIDTLYNDAIPSINFIWDTIDLQFNYADYIFLDTLEFTLFESNLFGFSDWNQNDTIYNGVPYKQVYDWYNYEMDNNCLSNTDNITNPEQTYGDGIGLIHYLDSTSAEEYYKLDLVYFQKGFITWGTPYDFSALDNPVQDIFSSAVNVFPNPAVDFIWVENFTPGAQVTIFDVNGKLALMSNQSENKIDISSLNPGCYFIVITSSGGIHYSKFIKTNF